MNTLTKKEGNKRIMASQSFKLCKVHRSVFFKQLIEEMNFSQTEPRLEVRPDIHLLEFWYADKKKQVYIHMYFKHGSFNVNVDVFRNVACRIEICDSHIFTKYKGLADQGNLLINSIRNVYVEHFAYRN